MLPELQVDQEDGQEDEDREPLLAEQIDGLLTLFREVLGDQVEEVRATDRLTNSLARLVDAKGSLGQEMQRVYKMMDKEYQIPKKILEINPSHNILNQLSELKDDDPLKHLIIEQIFESTLLIEGLHPDPASMIPRIQQLMELSLK